MTAVVIPALDVVDFLVAQHDDIRALVTQVARADVQARADAVRRVAALLETHEDLEARLVHPLAEQGIADGPAIAHARIVEENRADELLGQLITLDGADPRFRPTFVEFRDTILSHLDLEERGEFAALRAQLPHEHLVDLGNQARENRLWL